ncbi:TetR/AcrR family transcriptional regulator [Actinomadura madurae]|nr:TetR/AcrR family transcriptional regulator [Actinomadura madurae]MCP9955498.1 TetR/AcrR family transcriptional regulator [Actinomadura madurae]MCP9984737.1 TetR/AcrR family transcriptional regulator [Actinomadura madurae]MCQ0003716.1 TetR/AcrR family transcriptional regulator [Actinomadura madurae]MCQ0020926.1 TetR/AcrR family transcriptional regulator [Actinomadura madurae]URN00945.1 TetR/AcrR family transcriptional regulator [Actinomadura madurae]
MAYLPAEERRRSIIDAAVVVIASHGLAGATTRRIAEQAGAPLGALHYCFRNKAELIDVVAERGATMLREAFDDVDPDRGLEATIRDSVSAYWRWVQANLGLQLALLELGMWRIRQAAEGESVYSMYDAFGTDLLKQNLDRAVKAGTTAPAITVEEITRFITHRFDGMILEYAASHDRDACRRQADLLADALVLLALPG